MTVMADRAAALLEYLEIDPESDALLDALVRGLLAAAERLSIVAHGDGTIGPWQAIADPQVAPLWALPAAAIWTGGVMPARMLGESDEDYAERARADVVSPRGMRRGSPEALRLAALPYLTGSKTCRIAERLGGDPWATGVLVLEEEVPDLDALEAAVNDDDVITTGVLAVIDYLESLVWTMAELEDAYFTGTMSDLEGDFATMYDVENHEP